MTLGLDMQEKMSRRRQHEHEMKAKIQDIAQILYQHAVERNGLVMSVIQRQKIARQIMSEVLGYNTADIDVPVTFDESPYYDEKREQELDNQVEDILTQIRAKQQEKKFEPQFERQDLDEVIERRRNINVVEQQSVGRQFRGMPCTVTTIGLYNGKKDPFDEAMSILE